MSLIAIAWRFVTGSRARSLRVAFSIAAIVGVALAALWIADGVEAETPAISSAAAAYVISVAADDSGPSYPATIAIDAALDAGSVRLSAELARALYLPPDRGSAPWARFGAAALADLPGQSVATGTLGVRTVAGVVGGSGQLIAWLSTSDAAALEVRQAAAVDDVELSPATPLRRVLLAVFAPVLIAAVAAIVAAGVGTSETARRAERLSLSALGLTPVELRRTVVFEGALLGCIGAIVGAGLASLVTVVLRERGIDLSLIAGLFGIGGVELVSPQVVIWEAAATIAVAVCAGGAAALPAALRVGKIGADPSVWRLYQ